MSVKKKSKLDAVIPSDRRPCRGSLAWRYRWDPSTETFRWKARNQHNVNGQCEFLAVPPVMTMQEFSDLFLRSGRRCRTDMPAATEGTKIKLAFYRPSSSTGKNELWKMGAAEELPSMDTLQHFLSGSERYRLTLYNPWHFDPCRGESVLPCNRSGIRALTLNDDRSVERALDEMRTYETDPGTIGMVPLLVETVPLSQEDTFARVFGKMPYSLSETEMRLLEDTLKCKDTELTGCRMHRTVRNPAIEPLLSGTEKLRRDLLYEDWPTDQSHGVSSPTPVPNKTHPESKNVTGTRTAAPERHSITRVAEPNVRPTFSLERARQLLETEENGLTFRQVAERLSNAEQSRTMDPKVWNDYVKTVSTGLHKAADRGLVIPLTPPFIARLLAAVQGENRTGHSRVGLGRYLSPTFLTDRDDAERLATQLVDDWLPQRKPDWRGALGLADDENLTPLKDKVADWYESLISS